MPALSGPINIAQVQRGHAWFLREQDDWIRDSLMHAHAEADQHVRKHSTFKRRSDRSLKDKTRGRIVRITGGRKLKLTWTKPTRGGKYDLAELIEYGTKPHVISIHEIGGGSGSTRGKALRFRGRDGRWVFRRRVFHPGTRPYKFGWKASSAAYRVLTQRMDGRVKRARFRF